MGTELIFKHGLKKNLPYIHENEIVYCEDTCELVLGTVSGNVILATGEQFATIEVLYEKNKAPMIKFASFKKEEKDYKRESWLSKLFKRMVKIWLNGKKQVCLMSSN